MALRALRSLRDSDDDKATRLQLIANALQGTYESLRQAAANISGLLQSGKATCDEVKAYNLWAIAIFNTQRGMCAALRAGGQNDVPDPPFPTTFPFKGTSGADAINIDCSGEDTSLTGLGLMKRALKGPIATSRYLSYGEVEMSTSDPFVNNPTASPSYKQLIDLQNGNQQLSGLGFIQVLIIIAVITIAVTIGLAAIMHYLEVNEVQEANTEQTRLQAEAFANYTAARLQCLTQCTQEGKSTEDCVDICKNLIDKPNIKIPGFDKPWGMLQWVGFTVVVGAGAFIAWRVYQRHKAGRPVFELPESVEDVIHG